MSEPMHGATVSTEMLGTGGEAAGLPRGVGIMGLRGRPGIPRERCLFGVGSGLFREII